MASSLSSFRISFFLVFNGIYCIFLYLCFKVKVTWHTANYGDLYSEFMLCIYPSKSTHTAVNTHTPWTHTRSSGQPFMVRRSARSWGFGALLKGISVEVLRVERALYIHPPFYNSCWTETRTHKRSIMSPTLYHLATTFPQRQLQWSIKKDMSMPATQRLVIHGKRTTKVLRFMYSKWGLPFKSVLFLLLVLQRRHFCHL